MSLSDINYFATTLEFLARGAGQITDNTYGTQNTAFVSNSRTIDAAVNLSKGHQVEKVSSQMHQPTGVPLRSRCTLQTSRP